jgi:hypothetical protein
MSTFVQSSLIATKFVISVYGLTPHGRLFYRSYGSNEAFKAGFEEIPTNIWHLTIKAHLFIEVNGIIYRSRSYSTDPVLRIPNLSRFEHLAILWLDFKGEIEADDDKDVLILPNTLWLFVAIRCRFTSSLFFKHYGTHLPQRESFSAMVVTTQKAQVLGCISWETKTSVIPVFGDDSKEVVVMTEKSMRWAMSAITCDYIINDCDLTTKNRDTYYCQKDLLKRIEDYYKEQYVTRHVAAVSSVRMVPLVINNETTVRAILFRLFYNYN